MKTMWNGQDMVELLSRYDWYVTTIWLKYGWDMAKIRVSYGQDMFHVLLWHDKNMSTIFMVYGQNNAEIWPWIVWDMAEILLVNIGDLSTTFFRTPCLKLMWNSYKINMKSKWTYCDINVRSLRYGWDLTQDLTKT